MAKKIIKDIEKLAERKVIDISEIRTAHRIAEELKAHIASEEKLKKTRSPACGLCLCAEQDGYHGRTADAAACVWNNKVRHEGRI